MDHALPNLDDVRYEILPFGSAEVEAATVLEPLTLTVTCSPKQGIDHGVDVGCALRALGHTVIVHLAARMVRGPEHLEDLLERLASCGVGDVFLIGGDAAEPHGPYDSAVALLPELRAHANAPRTIGVAAYPEGHPRVPDDVLLGALLEKDGRADYMTTQICFDAGALTRWLKSARAAGVELPLYVGLPGIVDRRRLMEVSLRVGVGASISKLRRQNGLLRLLGHSGSQAARLHAAVNPLIGGDLGVAGLHYFTFNHLVETARFTQRLASATRSRQSNEPVHRSRVPLHVGVGDGGASGQGR